MRAVHVTAHAYEQAMARFPNEYAGRTHGSVCRTIGYDVADALAAGRVACNKPRWCSRFVGEIRHDSRRRVGKRRPAMRYCWPADLSRLYLVQRSSLQVLVVTVIRPGLEQAA